MRIKLIGRQIDCDNNEVDKIELLTDATIQRKNDILIVDYTEASENPQDNIITRLRVYPDKLIMTKLSTLSSTLEFEVNKKYYSVYSTIYGDFQMEINTSEYKMSLDNSGIGSIYLVYSIQIAENEPYTNILSMEIFE